MALHLNKPELSLLKNDQKHLTTKIHFTILALCRGEIQSVALAVAYTQNAQSQVPLSTHLQGTTFFYIKGIADGRTNKKSE